MQVRNLLLRLVAGRAFRGRRAGSRHPLPPVVDRPRRWPMKSLLAALLLTIPLQAVPAEELPIIDMHLHARTAGYAGDDPPAMCTPFPIMPRSDPGRGVYEGMAFNVSPPCARPIPAATSDAQVMNESIAAMERRSEER